MYIVLAEVQQKNEDRAGYTVFESAELATGRFIGMTEDDKEQILRAEWRDLREVFRRMFINEALRNQDGAPAKKKPRTE